MLRQAWNAYRGWAKAARDLQSLTQRWNLAALVCIIAAAVFGAFASVAPNAWSAWVAGAAAVASAVGAYLGRQIVGAGDEAGWIQARATAEGIKSECYRYAAHAGAYAVADADAEAAASQLWWVAFAAGLAAVAFGAAGIASEPHFAPWIGAMTTAAAAIAAYGLIDRRKYLIGSYAAMQSSLEQILGLDTATQISLADLVTTAEDLLDSEHKAWLPQMLGMQHQPPAQPTQAQAVGEGSS